MTLFHKSAGLLRLAGMSALILALLAAVLPTGLAPVQAQGGDQPQIVNIPGTLQPALGCPGDWAPDCEATFLEYNAASGLWARTFDMPAGSYEYKVAIDGTWDVNYGGAGDPGGANIVLEVPQDMPVTFVYDNATHLIYDSVRYTLGTVLGDFQTALGCEANDPACLASLMTDPAHSGVLSYGTYSIPAGDWAADVALGLSGAGVLDAPLAFTVDEAGAGVLFAYDTEANTLTITTVAPGAPFTPPGNLS